MKKLLSIIVTVAMLVSCLAPALAVSAADAAAAGLEVAVENVTFDPNGRGDTLTATATVSIVNNPGFAEATWYLYATNTEMNITEVKDVQSLAEGENGMVIEVSTNKSTTLGSDLKNAFAAANVATGSTVKAAVVHMVTADGESDVAYTGDLLEVTFEIAKDKADIVEGEAYTFGLIPGVNGECYNVASEEIVFAPITRTVTAYTDPNAPVYSDKQFDNFTFFVDDVVVKPGVDTVTVGFGFDGTNADFEKYGFLSVEIGFIYPETFKIIECVKGTAMDPDAIETTVQELTEGLIYYTADAPARHQEIFEACGYSSEGKTDKYVYQVHANLSGDDVPSFDGGYINYFTFDVSEAEPGTYELPIVTEGTVMGYDPDATGSKYIQWTSDYDLDAGHVTLTPEEVECKHENQTTTTVDATCTTDGSITVTCDDCGETISSEVIKSEGHKAGEKYTAIAPTYESEGKWQIDCSVCGTELESGSIPALVPAAKATVTLGDATVALGEQAKVDLTIDGSDYFIAIFDVTYDATVVDFVEFANDLGENVIVNETAEGVVRIYIEAEADANIAAGVAGTLVFDSLDYGTADIAIDVVDLVGYETGDIEYTATGATVKVVMPGNIVVGDAEAEYDSTVKVPVSVENSTGIWAGRVEIAYDAAALEFAGIESGLFAFVEGENYSVNDGVITLFLEAADMNDVVADGVLFAVEFKTLDAIGDTDVTVNIIDLINVAGEDLDYGVVSGVVTVTECKHANTTTEKVDATVDAAGYIKEICDKCGETVSETVIPALVAVYVTDYGVTAEEWDRNWVYINIKNNPGIWAARLEITLDEGLTFEDINGYLCDAVEGENYSVDGNVITVFFEADDMVNDEADNAIVAVSVSAAEVGTYGVSVKVLDLINVDGEDIDAVVTDGTVTFTECTHPETYEEKVDATVDAEGYINTICSKCGDVVETVVIPKLTYMYVAGETGEVYEDVKAYVAIRNNPGIWAARLEITVDETAEIKSVEGVAFDVVVGENCSINGNVITVFLEAADMANVEGDGNLIAITLYSEEEANVCVDLEVIDLINVDKEDIAALADDGTVIFTACTHAETYEEKVDATVDAEGYIKTICRKCGETLETVVLPKLAVIRPAYDSAEAGKDVYVDIETINTPGAWAYRLEITFDDVLTFKGVDSGLFEIDDTNHSVDGNVITVFIENSVKEDITEDGKLFGLIFATDYDAAGTAGISVKVVEVINNESKDVAFVAEDLTIEIAAHECTPGETVIENEVAADCVNGGSYDEVVYCTVCGEEVSRVTKTTPALGHTDGEWVIVKHPTAVDTGLKVQYCAVCGEVIAEEIIPVFESNGILGYYAESVVLDGERIDVVAKLDAIEVDFALELPEGATVEVPDGVYVAFDGNDYWYRSYPGLDSYELVVTFADGTVINYTVYVHFSFSAYEPVIIPGWSADSVEVKGDVIDVTVRKDVTEVDFALDLPAGATAEAFGDVEAIFDGNDTWYRVYNGTESFTLVVTLADGTEYTFTVNVKFDVAEFEAIATPGWSAESVVVDGNVINVTVKENIQEVDFALNLPEGATVVVTDGVECVFDGNDTWYRVYYGTGLDVYEITVTLANGLVYTYTVNVTFNVEKYDAEVLGGWSAANVAIDGSTVTVDVKEGIDVVDFAFTNLPEGATSAVSDNATIVFDGHDYWYGVERGTDNFTVTVTLASGVQYVYTVFVNFN